MLGNRNSRGSKHRFLILVYLICFILSLTPTIVAPPEKGFTKGQPEMHQSMDNMVSHGILLKKTGPKLAVSGATDYQALLTSKTSSLLDEAQKALSTIQNTKEKQWVEAFVQHMRAIAIMLERTAERKNQYLRPNMNSMSGTPVPEGLPSQPEWPAPSAVRGLNPFQKPSKMMSKFPVTSSELSQVLPDKVYPSERQVVTKPAMMSNKPEDVEDDELVRELKNLHKEFVAEVPVQSLKKIVQTPYFMSPVTSESPVNVDTNMNDVEMEKAKLEAKLLEEISMFQHLGGKIPKEIVDAVNGENMNQTSFAPMRKAEPSKSEEENGGMFDTLGREQLGTFSNEDKQISKTNSESLNNNPYQDGKYPQMKENHTFQNSHLHPSLLAFPKFDNHFPYLSSQSKGQPYQRGLENAIENLQKPNPFNFYENYRMNQQQSHIPDAVRQKMLRPENKIYNSHLAVPNYNEYTAKTKYRPYPYTQHWDQNNATLNLPPEMSPHMKPAVNHQIDTQLNDEMKRQLRDGKIVVLSDSVVRSNFETNKKEGTTEKEDNNTKIENNDKKNENQAKN